MNLLVGLPSILERKNLKPADLCRLSGLSSGAISSYMSGKRVPSIANTIAIADALHVSLDELVGRKPAHFATPPLSKDEKMLLDSYRDCTPKAKENVTEYAEFQGAKSKENGNCSEQSRKYA